MKQTEEEHAVLKAEVERLVRENPIEPTKKDTPLLLALREKHTELALALIKAGADVNATNVIGSTPLHMAIFAGVATPELVDALVKAGANLDTANVRGETPLHSAIFREQNDLALRLIKAGMDVNAQTEAGYAPLHFAAKSKANTVDVVQALLDAGADPAKKEKVGRNPVQLAIEAGKPEIVDMLLKAGAPISTKQQFIIRNFKNYLELNNRDKELLSEEGYCNGFAFLVQWFDSQGKTDAWGKILQTFVTWDGTREGLNQKLNAPLEEYGTVGNLFEELLGQLTFAFRPGEVFKEKQTEPQNGSQDKVQDKVQDEFQLGGDVDEIKKLYKSVDLYQQRRDFQMAALGEDKSFEQVFRNVSSVDPLSRPQLEEMLAMLQHFPGNTRFEIAGSGHATAFKVNADHQFEYWDSEFESPASVKAVDAKSFAELIIQTKYRDMKQEVTLDGNGEEQIGDFQLQAYHLTRENVPLSAFNYFRENELPASREAVEKFIADSLCGFNHFHIAVLTNSKENFRQLLDKDFSADYMLKPSVAFKKKTPLDILFENRNREMLTIFFNKLNSLSIDHELIQGKLSLALQVAASSMMASLENEATRFVLEMVAYLREPHLKTLLLLIIYSNKDPVMTDKILSLKQFDKTDMKFFDRILNDASVDESIKAVIRKHVADNSQLQQKCLAAIAEAFSSNVVVGDEITKKYLALVKNYPHAVSVITPEIIKEFGGYIKAKMPLHQYSSALAQQNFYVDMVLGLNHKFYNEHVIGMPIDTNQNRIIENFNAYLELNNRDKEFTSEGYCNGFTLFTHFFDSLGKRNVYKAILETLVKWDKTPKGLEEKLEGALSNYGTVGKLFEEFLSPLTLAQLGKKLDLLYSARGVQLAFLGQNEGFHQVFQKMRSLLLSGSQLTEMLEILRHLPENSRFEIQGLEHVAAFKINAKQQFEYTDSNFETADWTVIPDSQSLAKLFIKTQYLDLNQKMEVDSSRNPIMEDVFLQGYYFERENVPLSSFNYYRDDELPKTREEVEKFIANSPSGFSPFHIVVLTNSKDNFSQLLDKDFCVDYLSRTSVATNDSPIDILFRNKNSEMLILFFDKLRSFPPKYHFVAQDELYKALSNALGSMKSSLETDDTQFVIRMSQYLYKNTLITFLKDVTAMDDPIVLDKLLTNKVFDEVDLKDYISFLEQGRFSFPVKMLLQKHLISLVEPKCLSAIAEAFSNNVTVGNEIAKNYVAFVKRCPAMAHDITPEIIKKFGGYIEEGVSQRKYVSEIIKQQTKIPFINSVFGLEHEFYKKHVNVKPTVVSKVKVTMGEKFKKLKENKPFGLSKKAMPVESTKKDADKEVVQTRSVFRGRFGK